MKKIGTVFAAAVLWAGAAGAQPATGTSQLAWDQANATVTEAQAFTYRVYSDGGATGAMLVSVTCVAGPSSTICSAPFPAFTPGPHTLQLTAANAAGESAKSAVLSFTFVVVPSAPGNPRIQ